MLHDLVDGDGVRQRAGVDVVGPGSTLVAAWAGAVAMSAPVRMTAAVAARALRMDGPPDPSCGAVTVSDGRGRLSTPGPPVGSARDDRDGAGPSIWPRNAASTPCSITPGADLRYLTGYDALPLERLTCLVLPAEGDPTLVVPALERPAAVAAGVDVDIAAWHETDDPFALVAGLVVGRGTIGVDDHMWAERVFALAGRAPVAPRTVLAGPILQELRIRKEPDEVDALREAGAAIDRVHARMGEWLRPGRTEREVGADIARAIIDEGHETVDFVIVGSGPNGASPHHELSDRVIEPGDPVVVDIGGTTPAGLLLRLHPQLPRRRAGTGRATRTATRPWRAAQQAQRDHARPGVTAESVDAVGRADPRATRATATCSSTAPATASAWRRTRSPTSSPATHWCSSRAWRSRSSRASTSTAATAPASRTSSCAPPTASRS